MWLSNGAWSSSPQPLSVACQERAAAYFAVEYLAKRAKKILKKLENIEALDAQRRHKLRISVKKLRYASEFSAGLFDSRKQAIQRRRFDKTLKSLQGSLGTLNDIEVHKRLAVTIGHPRKRSRKQTQKALAMGFITGQEHQQIASCIAAAEKAGEQFSHIPKFWDSEALCMALAAMRTGP